MPYAEMIQEQTDREVHCGNCDWEGDIEMWVDWGTATGECPACLNDIVIEID